MPAITCINSTASVTLRVIDPTRSNTNDDGITPPRETSPELGQNATRLFFVAGLRSDDPVSVPILAQPNRAATPTADPLEEPPGILAGL